MHVGQLAILFAVSEIEHDACALVKPHYCLSHLCDSEDQYQVGPMQDDEMLLVFAFIRVTRAARILELGGLRGNSARNFLTATRGLPGSRVYTVDLRRVKSQDARHITLHMDATRITATDVDEAPLDFILLDCHHYNATMHTLQALESASLIHRTTTLALHDTGLHQKSRSFKGIGNNALRAQPDLVMHQIVERLVVEQLRTGGIDGTGRRRWVAVHAHRDRIAHDDILAFRHGITLMQLDLALDNNLQKPYSGEGADTGY